MSTQSSQLLPRAVSEVPSWAKAIITSTSFIISLVAVGIIHLLFPGKPWKDPGIIGGYGWLDKHGEVSFYTLTVVFFLFLPFVLWRKGILWAYNRTQKGAPLALSLAVVLVLSIAFFLIVYGWWYQ